MVPVNSGSRLGYGMKEVGLIFVVIINNQGTWLAQWVKHVTFKSQDHELKPHVGYGAYFKK